MTELGAAKNKLLLVDDNAINLESLLSMLGEDYDLRTAISGETALKLLNSGFSPDLILLDIMMPVMDGYEVCRRLKSDDATKDIPVIFLTSLSFEEDEVKGLELGAVDFISKPFTSALVKQRIKTHLQLKMKRDELLLEIEQKNNHLEQSLADIIRKEAYLQSIFRSAPIGIGLTVKRELQWVNQRMEELTGYSNAELKGRNARVFYPTAEEYERVGKVKYEQISKFGTGSVDTQFLTKDGSLLDVFVSSTPLNINDLSDGIIFTALDISERVKSQRDLEESEQRLKQAQRVAKIGNWEYDFRADQFYWSDEIYRIFDVDEQQFTPSIENFFCCMHPEDRDFVKRAYQDSLSKKEPLDIVHRLLLNDGTVKYVQEKCDTQFDDDGEPVVSRGTTQDVTKDKLAEQALQDSEEYQRVLSDASFEAIFLSENGICLGQNLTAEKMFGYSIDEAFNRPGTDWIAEPERKKVRAKMLTKGQKPYETVALRKDGTTFLAEIQARQMIFKGKSIRVTAVRDITRSKLQENIVATQLHLSQFSMSHTIEELLREFLDKAEVLTESQVGFFHYVNADQKHLSLQAWSSNTVQHLCTVADPELHYPVEQAGVWVDCIRQRKSVVHNDYNTLPHRKGLPEGHAPIIRELVVPVFRDDNIVAVLGVGNKPAAYTSDDIETVEKLADMAWDIITRKQAEEKIIKAKEEWEATFDSMNEMVTIHDRDMRIIRANKAAHDYWGVDYGDLVGKKCCNAFWHTEDPCPNCPLIKSFSDQGTHTETFCYVNPQRVLNVTSAPITSLSGESNYYICVASDTTQHTMMENALRTSEEQLRTLINATPDVICFKDGEGHWLEANQAILRLFNFVNVDFHGKTDRELADMTLPAFREVLLNFCHSDENAWEAKKEYRCQQIVSFLNGHERTFDVIKIPLFGGNGERRGLVVLGRDITELKQLQKEAEQSSRLASLGELAAGVAHEINNPNALTLYNSDLLDHIFRDLQPYLEKHQPEDNRQLFGGLPYRDALEEIPVLLPSIHDSAQRIKRIVNDLRDFARQDNTNAKEAVDLNEVVQSSIRLVQNVIKKATDSFTLELTQNLPMVTGIKGRLEQVLINLLVNSCQALSRRDQGISVKTVFNSDKNKVQIVVQDEGVGISAEMQGHVFEPFVTSKREQGGTGLGLSVSSRIVKEHRGELVLQSIQGQGTVATLSLTPLEDDL